MPLAFIVILYFKVVIYKEIFSFQSYSGILFCQEGPKQYDSICIKFNKMKTV
jgi:hypothetical protein